MRKNLLMVISGLILFFVLFESSFAYKNEPNGFRGIKWGTSIYSMTGFEYVKTEPSTGTEFYIKKNEDPTMGKAKLEAITYGFWQSKFCTIMISCRGLKNWTNLKDKVFNEFGQKEKSYQSTKNIEMYIWVGTVTDMLLRHDKISEQGIFMMVSKEIKQKQK